ncbi:transposase, partial [Paenibacillus larvae]
MLQEQEIRPVLPYTRPKTKEEFFKKHDYVYDEHYDCYLCPANAILSYETTNRAGYKMYRSNPAICQACPFRTQCTESKEAVKRISRHVWAECVEEADHLRHTEENK